MALEFVEKFARLNRCRVFSVRISLEDVMIEQQKLQGVSRRPGMKYLPLLAFPVGLLWMEIVVKAWNFRGFWNRGLLFTTLFTLALGVLLSVLCSISGRRSNRILSLLFMGGLTVFFLIQSVYYTVMRTVPAVYSVSVATDATEFWRVGVFGTWRTTPAILLLLIPFICLCIFGKQYTPDRLLRGRQLLSVLLVSVMLHGCALAAIVCSDSGILSPRKLYFDQGNPELVLANFGLLTALRIDMKRMLFPEKENEITGDDGIASIGGAGTSPQSHDPNVMDIDFRTLAESETDETLQSIHSYMAGQAPSMKNEYTGHFKGKNLIMITAEAFSSWAISPERTPTLYRLSHEGFLFQNYYTPLWWASTSDGEYVACTSLTPKAGEQSFGEAAHNSLYFCMGNQLRAQDYDTHAYHDHTYTYYGRNITHPNMGYEYQGIGNGLELAPFWPASDREMIEKTLPDYVKSAPFHAYYMTVSGHLQYFFDQNDMAKRHQDQVSQLPLSEEAQAYLACQIELDQALESLLTGLEEAGELDNTVICLYSDHYPYGLSEKAIEELAGPGVRNTTELYHGTLILWSGDMEEPVVVEKPCSHLDILPTLSNLFGLTFDSRLLMGRDILSDSPGLVIFSNSSYITELGSYDAIADRFTPAPGAAVPENYPQEMLRIVQDKILYSGKMLTSDYYRALGLIPST
jgi:phosphoglycerol transferase MdoB-like AlkP superfamily enzyme